MVERKVRERAREIEIEIQRVTHEERNLPRQRAWK